MIRDIFDKGRCLLGLHVGEWTYATGGDCTQARLCERCGTESTRVAHSWTDWAYDAPATCAVTRSCPRCGDTEHEVAHEWGDPYYAYTDSCERVRSCARCGEADVGEETHQLGEWEYSSETTCVQVRSCVRCGQHDPEGRLAHRWGEWEYSAARGGLVVECGTCGEVVDVEAYPLVEHAPVAVTETPTSRSTPSPLASDLLQRRDAVVERLWDVEDAAPSPESREVLDAAAVAVEDLGQLLSEWDPTDWGALETGKTWRYLGDAYFSLSGKEDTDALRHAREAYAEAEAWVERSGDRLELAKLNFNLANTLRLVDGWQNRALLEEAKDRYLVSLGLFREEMPEAVAHVESSIGSLEVMLRTLSTYEAAELGLEKSEMLRERLETTDPDDEAALREVSEAFDAMLADEPAPEEQLQEFVHFFERTAPLLAGNDPETGARYDEMLDELAALSESFSDGDEEATDTDELFRGIYAALEAAGESGEVDANRQAALYDILKQFEGYAGQGTGDPEAMLSRIGKMRDVISDNKHIFAERRLTGGRTGVVDALFSALSADLIDQSNQSHLTEAEQEVASDLFLESARVRSALLDAGDDDAAVLAIEHDRLRPLVHRARRFGLRRHLTLARPLWGWPEVEVDPNHVFFAGGDTLEHVVERLCAERRLQLSSDEVGWDAGQVRWNQLRESSIGVFDLTVRSPSEQARVCHALGSALALGVYPIVVVDAADTYLPFDIDMPPVRVGDDDPAAVLGAAIDRALYGTFATKGVSSLDATIRRVVGMLGDSDVRSAVFRDRLTEDARLDPVDAKSILEQLVQLNAPGETALLEPIWPAFYPDEGAPRCFHVMPFFEPWSDDVREWVRDACTESNVRYRRGDEAEEVQVIHSIWEEISRATHVVVDLTGLSLSVCMELAMAQALGRPTLLVAQDDGTLDDLFPEIAKLQVRTYPAKDGAETLERHVRSFLAA